MGKNITTREKILEAAADTFADLGFEGARMEGIARLAGVNKASIYYNIGNKETLYDIVLNQMYEVGFSNLHKKLTSKRTSEGKLAAYVTHLAAAIRQNPRIPRIMMREQVSQGKHMPDSFARNIVIMLEVLGSILESGAKEGKFEKVDTLCIHFMILGMLMFEVTSAPIRRNKSAFLPKFRNRSELLSQPVVDQIIYYIVKAVKKGNTNEVHKVQD